MVPIKVVFQGGGAKLVTLMAAASVLRDLEADRQLELRRVVGVSAGAIVACLLSSRTDGALWRLRVLESAGAIINLVDKQPNTFWTLVSAWRGKPILPEAALRKFLNKLFHGLDPGAEGGALKYLGQLKIPTTVVAASARHAKKVVYTSEGDSQKEIEDAVADSCALPLIFRTYADSSLIIDGGVCGNLPDAEALAGKDDVSVLGFTFAPEEAETPTSVKGYAMAVIATSMDSAVRDSAARIVANGGEVCELPQKFGTLEFRRALDEGLDEAAFNAQRDDVRPKIVEALQRIRQRRLTATFTGNLDKKLARVFNQSVTRAPYLVNRAAMIVTADSLRPLADPHYRKDDEVRYVAEFAPKGADITCVRLGLALGNSPPDMTAGDIRVETLDGHAVSTEQAVVKDVQGGIEAFYLMIFLETPSAVPIRVMQRTRQGAAVPSLKGTGGRAILRSGNARPVDSVVIDLVLIYPDELGPVTLFDLKEHVALLDSTMRPDNLDGVGWTKGAVMTGDSLDDYRRLLAPPTTRMVGWRVEAVAPGHGCGVIFARQ